MNLSAIKHINYTQQRRQAYIPAEIKMINITTRRIICQSGPGGNDSMNEVILDENDFEQL